MDEKTDLTDFVFVFVVRTLGVGENKRRAKKQKTCGAGERRKFYEPPLKMPENLTRILLNLVSLGIYLAVADR